MPLNLIIKKAPSWRPLQPKLGSFVSKHRKDSSKVSAVLSVEEQFTPAELWKIANACRFTEKLGVDMTKEEVEQ